jgi:O-antigen/teichoic acid export membrane protein
MDAIQRLWRSRLRRDTLLLIALQLVYRLSGAVLLAALSRCLPAGDLGVYFFALSFDESFTLIANFRLSPILMRRVAADPGQAATHFAPLLGFRLLSSPLYLLCVSVAAVTFTGAIWRVVVLVACATLLENCSFTFTTLFRALRKIGYVVAIGTGGHYDLP